jgi:GT2 family glycosyltransferase
MINIIILTYNNLSYTKKCIDNLYKFTKDFNLIIVDNKSNNDTIFFLEELRNKYENVVIEFNDENKGVIKGRNQGINIANQIFRNSEFLFIIDNDQYVLPKWLDSYMELFEKGYDIIGCEAWMVRDDFYPIKKIINPEESFHYVGAGGLMLTINAINDLKGFDEDYTMMYFEDPSFCWEAHKSGYKIGWNYNKVITHDHKGPLLIPKNKQYFINNWKKIQEKWKGKIIPTFKMP